MARDFGSRLRGLRRAKKLGLRALAAKATVPPGYLSELERRQKTNPSAAVVMRLAKALGVPVTRLLE